MVSKLPALELAGTEKDAAAGARSVISVQDIVHRYENRTALNGVSFDVRPAELFGLLGPNGSGKTTLFRILSTLMLPTAGHAVIMGHDAASEPNEVRRQIGVVFQAQSIDVKLTAAENLWHQGHLYGLRGAALKSRIAEMLSRVGLADRAREKAETFSGGMQRRLELAKGLLHRPAVLLLDEPTTGLDPGARRLLPVAQPRDIYVAEPGGPVLLCSTDLEALAAAAAEVDHGAAQRAGLRQQRVDPICRSLVRASSESQYGNSASRT